MGYQNFVDNPQTTWKKKKKNSVIAIASMIDSCLQSSTSSCKEHRRQVFFTHFYGLPSFTLHNSRPRQLK